MKTKIATNEDLNEVKMTPSNIVIFQNIYIVKKISLTMKTDI